ncbi:hypothetical protein [Agrobacterium vitis]|uniref:Uncharacterized protein n=1 Tax=Agrobacterium vitis TaxID=373 RepID=A0A7K1RND7_AGRVI|nr:hypothetical protein [Agrobacterium vitis]MVA59419.1 hypothetical protein [Agrobacterium vitis]
MIIDDIDAPIDLEKRVRYYAAAQVSLFAASRAAHELADDFFIYLIQMALDHLEALESTTSVN